MTVNRSQAGFVVAVAVLAGGALNMIGGIVGSYFFTDTLPDTPVFRWIVTLWSAVGLIGAGCGIAGVYVALRTGRFSTALLTIFCALYCFGFKVDGIQLRWTELAIAFGWTIRSLDFTADVNVLGLVLLVWLWFLRGGSAMGEHRRDGGLTPPHAA